MASTASIGAIRARRDSEVRSAGPATARRAPGLVSLVGAGPGDPGLITVKGAEKLRSADVVFHDTLVSPELLGLCRPDARVVAVGKRRGAASVTQEAIEAALIEEARSGRAVVRLKGGDPFVFGRGGEEALTLVRHGIPVEVIPGVTAGTAVPAIAGIPLTHRGLASSAAFLTAHDLARGPGGRRARERLVQLAKGADTLVLFMAGAQAARVRQTLLEAGLPGGAPVAVIESGTTAAQTVAIGELAELERLTAREAHEPRRLESLPATSSSSEPEGRSRGPVLIVIGPTVALARQLRAAVLRGAAAGDERDRVLRPGPGTIANRTDHRTDRNLPLNTTTQAIASLGEGRAPRAWTTARRKRARR